MKSEAIENQDGKIVFSGTEIVISILFNYLKAGRNINVFLDDYPKVNLQQVHEALELADEQLTGFFLAE